MASPIGSLVVRIGADTSDLLRGVEKAQAHIGKLGSGLRSGINVAGKYAAAMAAAGAAVASALVRNAMDAIDAQAKLARQIRATNVGLETLMRAADLAGVEKEKMTMAVRRLDVAIGESIRGTKTYADAFDKLGLSAREVSEMDADERIKAVNQALLENVSAAEQAQVAGVLFGNRVGMAVASISADEIKTAREEVEALGLAVSEVDSTTIERASDALSTIGEVFRGAMNRVVVQIAPLIEGIANALRSAALESRGFESQINQAFSSTIRVAGFLADMIQGLRVAFKGVELIATGFGATLVSVFELAAEAIATLADGVNMNVNAVIAGLNKIPGVDIPALDTNLRDSELMTSLHEFGEQARNKVGEVRSELNELAMQEMPSTKVEKFLAAVTEASRIASEEAVKARVAITGGGDGSGELEEIQTSAKPLEDETAKRLELLRQRYGDEAALEQERYAEELEALNAQLILKRVSEEEHQALLEEMARQHQQRLTEIEQEGLTERQKFEQMTLQDKVSTALGHLTQMTAGVAQHSKRMFELNKKAALAEAIVEGIKGAERTWNAYPFPLNVPMTAAHIAGSVARISAIRSSTFQGGGAGAAPSVAGTTAATPVSPVSSQIITVRGIDPGQFFSGRQLVELLNQASKDGAKLVLAN